MGKRTNTAVWVESLNRWQIKVQKDGVRRTFVSSVSGRKGQRECNAKADAWLDEGLVCQNRRIEELYVEWLESVQKATSQSHWRPLESRWRTHILPVMAAKRIDKVSEGQWQDLINAIYAEGKSRKTLQSYCEDIRAFYKWARAHNYADLHLEALQVPKGARNRQRKILQPDGLRILFADDWSTWKGKPCVDPLVRAYRFQVAAGLRPGELIGLRWKDIVGFHGKATNWSQLSGGLVLIRQAINTYGETTSGKNQNAQRSFVMFPLLAQILQEQYAYTGRDVHIFPIDSERSYYGAWQRYCKAHEIPPTSLYELRHTFVSIVKVLPAGEVKSWVGHSSNMDTFGIYAHALRDDVTRVADDFAGLYQRLLQPFEEVGTKVGTE